MYFTSYMYTIIPSVWAARQVPINYLSQPPAFLQLSIAVKTTICSGSLTIHPALIGVVAA